MGCAGSRGLRNGWGRAYLEAEVGKRAADLETAPPPRQGERTDLNGTSVRGGPKSDGGGTARRLRAILRAPESIQALYREGKCSPPTPARPGPPQKNCYQW